jgi:streptomycin 6-kinase
VGAPPRRRLSGPGVDDGVRRRLTTRFGPEVAAWFDDLPEVYRSLSERWGLELGAPIPRGSVAVVSRCRMPDGRSAVLKVSPDRGRLAREAAALERWTTPHTPAVLAVDERLGALVIEAIEPGTPLDVSATAPSIERTAELLRALHAVVPCPSVPAVAARVASLFAASAALYAADPRLAELIPPGLYERGRLLAMRLAGDGPPAVLLHGDLTPSNILDGGPERGLVAIDPAPCRGDPAFDAIDLVLWRADDVAAIEVRAQALAAAIGADAERLLHWCTAFAGMTALELAGLPDVPPRRVGAAATLAARAP